MEFQITHIENETKIRHSLYRIPRIAFSLLIKKDAGVYYYSGILPLQPVLRLVALAKVVVVVCGATILGRISVGW